MTVCVLLLPAQVQLQLLTATVKLFLKKPTDSVQRMIQLVLSAATNETDNPDLRDRAYVYWRLLSTDPEVCRRLWPFAAWFDEQHCMCLNVYMRRCTR